MINLETAALIEELRENIRKHEYLYFVESKQEISDLDFDKLMKKLQELENQYPELVTVDSPTQRVGGAITSFNTVKHRVPMMSIENSYSIEDISDWILRLENLAGRSVFPIVAELKIDGVSGSFHYNGGLFVDGSTRGNGLEGDIVTENLRTIKSLPLRIKAKRDMDVRGEIFTPRSMLEKLNDERLNAGDEPFKNCRNLTSGTIKSLDPSVAASRGLQIMAYGIAQAAELGFKAHSEALEFLRVNGFKMNHAIRICTSMDEIKAFIEQVDEQRKGFDFDIDGIVLKVDDLHVQEELGVTSKAPRWAIAYKYPQERAISQLLSVDWQVGRSQITPVANLEPVELGGTTVSRASLHNIDQINEKDIRIGDFVVVEKAGYIIPYIVKSLPEKRSGQETVIQIPTTCPECMGPVSIISGTGDENTQVSCVNSDCRGVVGRKILHFITQMEIENFGPQLVDQLLEKRVVNKIEDIFALKFDQLLSLERMGEKSAEKIIINLENAKKATLGRVISALGIPNVGIVIAEKIAEYFEQSLQNLLKTDKGTLMKIDGISDKVADYIISYLNSSAGILLIEGLQNWWEGPNLNELKEKSGSDKLAGKIFVVTGEAEIPRKQIEKIIKSHGGSVKSSVSKNTDFLLIGSKVADDFQSSKKNKALELKVAIISEKFLFEKVGIEIETIKNLG